MVSIIMFQEYSHDDSVLTISIKQHIIASGSLDRSCQVWNIQHKERLYVIRQDQSVDQIELFPTESSFDLICSGDKKLKIWKEGKLVQSLEHSNYSRRFQLNSDNSMLAVGYGDDSVNPFEGGVKVWSTADWTELEDFEFGSIHGVSFTSDSNRILAASKSGSLSVILFNDEQLDELLDETDSEYSSEASD